MFEVPGKSKTAYHFASEHVCGRKDEGTIEPSGGDRQERRKSIMRTVGLLAAAIGCIITTVLTAPVACAQVFSFKWGTVGSDDGRFSKPVGIGIDSSGNVYVSDQDNNRIQKFDTNGSFLTKWGSAGDGDGEFSGPQGIGIDSSDYVYVADWGNNRIQKFDNNGNFLVKWGTLGDKNGEFNNPHGIAIDSGDFVYVTDFFNDRVQKFTSNGTFITKWGSKGNGDGQFNNPRAIVADSLDNIYVSDANNRIQKFDILGRFLFSWGTGGTSDAQFLDPMGIGIDSSGNLFVSEWGNNRVQKFDRNGAFITKWGIFGLEDGQFRWAYGVAVQTTGAVYVVDSEKNEIQVFTPPLPATSNGTGRWVFSWTNNRITNQVGALCVPESDQTGTVTVSQRGQSIRIATIADQVFTGFVSGSDVNASTSYFESGGVSGGEIISTLSSNTGGSGVLRYSWTDNVGSFCTGEADLSFTKQIPSSGGGGGGGGCFIAAAFN
jgi:tripartite motif-containing protein 71